MMSHRSGETEDTTIADLAVACTARSRPAPRPAPSVSPSTTSCSASRRSSARRPSTPVPPPSRASRRRLGADLTDGHRHRGGGAPRRAQTRGRGTPRRAQVPRPAARPGAKATAGRPGAKTAASRAAAKAGPLRQAAAARAARDGRGSARCGGSWCWRRSSCCSPSPSSRRSARTCTSRVRSRPCASAWPRSQLTVEELQKEQARWSDNAYVEQQARERLKFVKIGDRSYTVIDGDPPSGSGTRGGGRAEVDAGPPLVRPAPRSRPKWPTRSPRPQSGRRYKRLRSGSTMSTTRPRAAARLTSTRSGPSSGGFRAGWRRWPIASRAVTRTCSRPSPGSLTAPVSHDVLRDLPQAHGRDQHWRPPG